MPTTPARSSHAERVNPVVLTVHFVRHGEGHANAERVFANRPDHPAALTPTGIAQAETLARSLAGGGITHLYSSPLLRARQTAEVLASALGLEVAINDGLREYDVGDFEGLPYGDEHGWRWEEYERVDRTWQRGERDARLAGGESLADIERRFLRFMRTLTDRHAASDRVAIVSHGGLYRSAFPALFAQLDADATRRLPIGHCDAIVTTHQAGVWRLVRWGDRVITPPGERPRKR